jgi:hypothetical protein
MPWVSSVIVSLLFVLGGCNEIPLVSKPERQNMAGNNPEEFFEEGTYLDLARAIAANDLSGIQKIVSADETIELNTIHKKDMTVLHYAFLHQNVEAMKLLVNNGASPHVEIKDVGSVFGIAVGAKDLKFLEALLESGVSANSTDRWEMPHFFAAATKDDDCETLRVFAKHGADFNIQSSTGRTAAMHAFASLAYDQVEFLIEQDINLESQTKNGVTLAWFLELELEQQKKNPKSRAYQKLIQLQSMMVERGVKFPATRPEKLRSQ